MAEPLQEQQRRMAAYLRDPEWAAPPAGVEARRLGIYRDLVYRNIESFVSSAFPVLRRLYDDTEWEALLREFIRGHRCESPLFLRISEEFLAFLAAREIDPERPFAAELAHWEWLELAVDVAEGDVPEAPRDCDPERATARMAATARLGVYHFPVHRIGPDFRPLSAQAPTALLVYRDRDDRVQFMELNAATGHLVREVAAGGAVDGATVASLLRRIAAAWDADPEALVAHGGEQLFSLAGAGAIDWRSLPATHS